MKEKCRHTLEQAYLFLDGEGLSVEERHEIEVHLVECKPCFERYGLDSEVTVIIQRLRGSARCPEGLRAKITEIIREA
jgi:mycothiol system anti-sigma-R factor